MPDKHRKHRRKIALLAAGLTAAAVVKELRKPPDKRTWHGRLGGALPYDFRIPTVKRARSRWWNPDAPYLTPRVFGVGWDLNVGRIVDEARRVAHR
ncbi:MAG: DUF5808 domain-containing protein [Gaiellales bacterium]